MSGDPFGLIGHVIDSQLRVDKAIGEGGAGVVYKGHHLGLDEPVAIKCLKLQHAPDAATVESFVRRFRDESRICYRLSRGNLDIVRSITSGTTQSARGALVPYMALEWLEGRSLETELKERRAQKKSGRSLEEVLALFDPAAEAIAYAHAQGVVHRDIKPANLFLSGSIAAPRMKVLDFGLAKILHDDVLGRVPHQTGGGVFPFSPSYGAPEQFDPKMGKIGPWTDVYALAVVILEALRDRKVRSSDSVANDVIRALDPDRRPTPRELGVEVGDAVEAAMAKAVALHPDDRHRDAGAFWKDLHDAMHKDGAVALTKTAESEVPSSIARQMKMEPRMKPELGRTEITGPPLKMTIDARLPQATTVRMHEAPKIIEAPESEATEGGTGTLVMPRNQMNLAAPALTPTPTPAPSAPPPPVPTPPPSRPPARHASERPKRPELSQAVGPWLDPAATIRTKRREVVRSDAPPPAPARSPIAVRALIIIAVLVAIAIFGAHRAGFF